MLRVCTDYLLDFTRLSCSAFSETAVITDAFLPQMAKVQEPCLNDYCLRK